MITIRIKSTGEIREVTKNVAFDLIDGGVAVLATTPFSHEERKREERRQSSNVASQNTPKTSDRAESDSLYLNRQMRSSGNNR